MNACKSVADKVEESDEDFTAIEVKMMVEEELGYGLDKKEMLVLALTFKHIDNVFAGEENDAISEMIYQ